MINFIKRACDNKTPIQIIYIDNDHQISQRTIEVLAISQTTVKAYCYTKCQFRQFKLSNILSVGSIKQGRVS
ncbi:hypothetical protein J11TS1_33790 [Oceanobacillus sp. J11TS1]|nr:hypothetical protein J11TS1_33790 [Oceanobacillus sp. J11TS1]